MKYIYFAPWYCYNLTETEILREKRICGALALLSTVLFFAVSLTPSHLNYSIYVELPATLSLAALVFEILGVVQFCASKRRMTQMTYRDIEFKMKLSPVFHGLLLLITGICCLLHMLTVSYVGGDEVIVLGYFLSAALSLSITLRFRKIKFKTEHNKAIDQIKKQIDG